MRFTWFHGVRSPPIGVREQLAVGRYEFVASIEGSILRRDRRFKHRGRRGGRLLAGEQSGREALYRRGGSRLPAAIGGSSSRGRDRRLEPATATVVGDVSANGRVNSSRSNCKIALGAREGVMTPQNTLKRSGGPGIDRNGAFQAFVRFKLRGLAPDCGSIRAADRILSRGYL